MTLRPRAAIALLAMLIAAGCGGGGATPSATSAASPAAPATPSAVPAASATTTGSPEAGALPSPDLVFEAEDCAADEVCRQVPVARVSSIPFTSTVPCAEDGTTCVLHLDLYYPAEARADGTPYPVAVFAKGGPDVPSTDGTLAPLLAGQGVVVIDGSWRQSTRFAGGGLTGIRDIACTISAARSLAPKVGGAGGPVTLIGHSLGGWAGSVIALTPDAIEPDTGQCLFTDGDPAPDAFVGLSGAYTSIHDGDQDASWEGIVGVPRAEDPDAWAALDPIDLVDRHGAPAIPVTLMHGGADGVVPLAESEALAAALTGAGTPTSVQVEAGVDHGGIRDAAQTIRTLAALLGTR